MNTSDLPFSSVQKTRHTQGRVQEVGFWFWMGLELLGGYGRLAVNAGQLEHQNPLHAKI